MRFVAFIDHAVRRNITQVLLPAVRWGDSYNKGRSLGHEYLFDVDYWNKRAAEKGLPRLVDYDREVLDAAGCFNESSGLWVGLDEGWLRHNETNLRHWDGNAEIKKSPSPHCRGTDNNNATHLIPIGAGKGAGIFWDDYYKLQKQQPASILEERPIIEQSIFQLLRPSFALRTAMQGAIQLSTASNRTQHSNNSTSSGLLMALHPRVEQEMMTHRCHVFHEQNLTRVFERIGSHPEFFSATGIDNTRHFKYSLLFIAVSAYQVEKPPRSDPKAAHLRDVMVGNKDALLHARRHGVFGIPTFESGASTAKLVQFLDRRHDDKSFDAESLGVVELVASIIDFFTSVTADVFIGVRGSSFSTDVFAVRHYRNKDVSMVHGGNYIISPDGIEELVGPPKVHSC